MMLSLMKPGVRSTRWGVKRALSTVCGATDADQKKVKDVVIIGSGPSGYTAAIYAARANLSPVVYAGYSHGGQLMLTSDVENFPGNAGLMGPEIMDRLRKQAESFGAKIVETNVESIDVDSYPFRMTHSGGEEVEARSVIVSTGAEALWLDAPGEKELRGRGISTCATCDGAFFRDQHCIVVGGGDAAMEEAVFLTRFAKKVTLVHRRAEFRASSIMVQRARDNPKIEIITSHTVEQWLGDDSSMLPNLRGVLLKDLTTGELREIACEGAFIAIGHRPMTDIFRGKLALDEDGYLLHKDHTMTSVPGIFAAGDVVDRRYRQAITAAGMGCQAAIDAERWLAEEQEGLHHQK